MQECSQWVPAVLAHVKPGHSLHIVFKQISQQEDATEVYEIYPSSPEKVSAIIIALVEDKTSNRFDSGIPLTRWPKILKNAACLSS